MGSEGCRNWGGVRGVRPVRGRGHPDQSGSVAPRKVGTIEAKFS